TKIICDLCEQSYKSKTSVSNLKRHFLKYHKNEYQSILQQYFERTQRIKCSLSQNKELTNLRNVQVTEDDEYLTEEEREEVVVSGEVLNKMK
ncbi:5853_t:CDS:1, partial [Dentiscutata heterogama]